MFSLFYRRFANKNAGIDERFWSNMGKTGKRMSSLDTHLNRYV